MREMPTKPRRRGANHDALMVSAPRFANTGDRKFPMKRLTYTDNRIEEVRNGAPLTAEERADLLEHTPNFEECSKTRSDLESMSDADLMTEAMWVWQEYCR